MTITEKQCEKTMGILNRTYKHKLNIAQTAPNTILYNPAEYGFFHIADRQILMHANNWYKRINDQGLLGKITRMRLQELQNRWWSTSVVSSTDFTKPFLPQGQDLTHDITLLLRQQGFTGATNHIHTIKKIDTTIEEIMGETWYDKHRGQLAKNQIMFLHQITNYTGTRLVSWPEVTHINRKPNRKKPKWFHEIQQNKNITKIIED